MFRLGTVVATFCTIFDLLVTSSSSRLCLVTLDSGTYPMDQRLIECDECCEQGCCPNQNDDTPMPTVQLWMSALIAFVLTFTMLVFFLALLVYCKTKNCNKSVPQIQDGDDRVEAPMVTVILPERNEAICLQTANESREIPVTPPPSYEQAVFVK